MDLMTVTNAPVDGDQPSAISPQARTALWASLVGTTIEWYDFFLYATAASLVFNKAFFPDQTTFVGTMLSFATFAVGFLVRPIGGFVFGHVGDRIGRKKTLALTMFLMGGATALMGVLPTAAQIGVLAPILLLLLRIVQGFALGGEWAGAVLLAVEHGPPRRRGLFGSIPQVGLALGLALGTGVFALLQIALPDDAFLTYGWRIAFLLSIVLVIFGVVVRLRASETPAFEKVRDSDDRAAVPLREVFKPPVLRSTVLGMLSRWGEGAAFNTWGVFAISYATGTLKLDKVPVLIVRHRGGPADGGADPGLGSAGRPVRRRSGCTPSESPPTASRCSRSSPLFGTRNIWLYALAHAGGVRRHPRAVLRRAGHAVRVAVPGPDPLHRAVDRLPAVGVYASGLTPLILTALIGAAGGTPWIACGYLVATAVISVVATLLLEADTARGHLGHYARLMSVKVDRGPTRGAHGGLRLRLSRQPSATTIAPDRRGVAGTHRRGARLRPGRRRAPAIVVGHHGVTLLSATARARRVHADRRRARRRLEGDAVTSYRHPPVCTGRRRADQAAPGADLARAVPRSWPACPTEIRHRAGHPILEQPGWRCAVRVVASCLRALARWQATASSPWRPRARRQVGRRILCGHRLHRRREHRQEPVDRVVMPCGSRWPARSRIRRLRRSAPEAR